MSLIVALVASYASAATCDAQLAKIANRDSVLSAHFSINRRCCERHQAYTPHCVKCDIFLFASKAWADRGTAEVPATPAIPNTEEGWVAVRQHIEAARAILAPRGLFEDEDTVCLYAVASDDGLQGIRELALRLLRNPPGDAYRIPTDSSSSESA